MEIINIIYSYSSMSKNDGYASKYHLALSIVASHHSFISSLKNFTINTILVTDTEGKKFFVDECGLWFGMVDLRLDNLNKAEFAKLHAYRQINLEQFVHINLDTFLFKTFPVQVLNYEVFCDFVERNNQIDILAFEKCAPYISFKDSVYSSLEKKFKNSKTIWSMENGVFGGKNTGIIAKYVDDVSKFFTQNKRLIERSMPETYRLIERMYAFEFFNLNNIQLGCLINRNKETESDMFQHKLDHLNYIRLYGQAKTNSFLIESLEKLVKNFYPDSYEKIKHLKND